MLKNLLTASAILAATTGVAMADFAPYIGASLGITTNTTEKAATILPLPAGSPTVVIPGNFRGVPFNLFAGYGGIVNQNFYLAAEAFVTVATAEISNSYGVKTSYGYGASLLPGVMLSDHTLAFARLGVVRSHFTGPGQNGTGGQVGIGVQTCLTQNIDLRAEYDFTAYKTVENLSAPRQDSYTLGLVYKFE